VGISGFYKEPIFSLICGEIPIMMDDTCYFLSFNNITDALITLALLNSSQCINFLKSIAFVDSKRPYTKEVLRRVDLEKLAKQLGFTYVESFLARELPENSITEEDYNNYCHVVSHNQLSLA
jgi:hypothetical protein